MIDFILFTFFIGIVGAAFYGGVKVGSTYQTVGKFVEEIGRKISEKEPK
jgi:hypothetical protein